MRRFLRPVLILLLLCGLPLCGGVLAAEASPELDQASVARQELLDLQGFLLWQGVNEARINPRAALRRLGISAAQASAVLGDESWLLDDGLPPLAWNDDLRKAAVGHGRDMFNRLYYSHLSPEGLGPMERIAAAGYQAVVEDETLAALVFQSYVDIKVAVDFMVDTMIRDELLGTPGVRRNIFSPSLTEVGIAFFAESVAIVDQKPYIYLFVLDFAAPLTPRRHLIGAYNGEGDVRPLMASLADGVWTPQENLVPGMFQISFPEGGAAFSLFSDDPEAATPPVVVYDLGGSENLYVDLRMVQ